MQLMRLNSWNALIFAGSGILVLNYHEMDSYFVFRFHLKENNNILVNGFISTEEAHHMPSGICGSFHSSTNIS